jgi:hypothetical protein
MDSIPEDQCSVCGHLPKVVRPSASVISSLARDCCRPHCPTRNADHDNAADDYEVATRNQIGTSRPSNRSFAGHA